MKSPVTITPEAEKGGVNDRLIEIADIRARDEYFACGTDHNHQGRIDPG